MRARLYYTHKGTERLFEGRVPAAGLELAERVSGDTTIGHSMTYAELPGGGAIFAVGSITFCGSLSHNRYDNNVSRILRNVIERFGKPR